jgi:hypothetical protein
MHSISIAPRRGFELAIVADSGFWIGHGIVLVAGNRYKGESRNTTILRSAKKCPGFDEPGHEVWVFGLRITLLLGFWCFAITFLLKMV